MLEENLYVWPKMSKVFLLLYRDTDLSWTDFLILTIICLNRMFVYALFCWKKTDVSNILIPKKTAGMNIRAWMNFFLVWCFELFWN